MRYTPSVLLSVRLCVCPVSTINSKVENHTTIKRREEVADVRSRPNCQNNFKGKKSKMRLKLTRRGNSVSIHVKPLP